MQLSFGNEPLLYVAGYQGRDLGAFVRLANRSGVVQVIDVRETPVSRRPGFGKRSIEAALAEANIAYVHVPEADNPHRHEARNGALDRYREHLRAHPEIVERVAALVHGKTSLLLSFDRDASSSHRSELARAVAERENLKVVAL